MIKKIIRVIKNPYKILLVLDRKRIITLSDKKYLKYRGLSCGMKLDIDNPKTFNEKLQWLKINNRNPIYSKMVDKYEVKEYIKNVIGEEYIIPTLGIYNKYDEIDFSKLPDKFVIKCTHDSASIMICRDKKTFNYDKCREKISKALRVNYYYGGREYPYRNVKPRIIIEKYMEDKDSKELRDYKFFCFNGEPKIMYLSEGMENHDTASMSFFDMNFKVTDCKRKDYKFLNYTPKKPACFDKMKELASILSKDIPHVRVDFYVINGKIYFGELTFYTCSGYLPFESEEWNLKMGDWIDLSKVTKYEK